MTLSAVGENARDLGGRLSAALGMTDTFGNALIFALQASLCALATLWLAMWIQLDTPYWAASTVLITAQATRSQSLLKGANRVFGTLVGIGASIVIVALFPQHWWSFALALSGWLALCTFVACLLRALQAYAAALSGYTALIVLTDSFGNPNGAFATALSRGSCVVLGVSLYVLTAVLLIPARGTRELRDAFEAMFADVRSVAAAVLRGENRAKECAALMARWSGLDEKIEEAATDGLWPPGSRAGMRRASLAMADLLVASAAAADESLGADRANAAAALDDTTGVYPIDLSLRRLESSAAALRTTPDGALPAAAVTAMVQVRAGLDLLRTGVAPFALGAVRRTVHRDYFAALYAAVRAFAGLFLAFGFWIWTRWPNGSSFVLIVGILCCLFATRPSPIVAEKKFTVGTLITAVLALLLGFFVVPRQGTFLGLSACLLPVFFVGAFGLKSSKLAAFCTPTNFFLLPMIDVRNRMAYDPSGFFNSSGAIVCGCCAGIVVFQLAPPFSKRVEAEVLRWWISRERRCPVPRTRRSREERRLRLYDRLGLLASRLEPDEAAAAFETVRPLASRLQDVPAVQPPASGSLLPETSRSASTPRRNR